MSSSVTRTSALRAQGTVGCTRRHRAGRSRMTRLLVTLEAGRDLRDKIAAGRAHGPAGPLRGRPRCPIGDRRHRIARDLFDGNPLAPKCFGHSGSHSNCPEGEFRTGADHPNDDADERAAHDTDTEYALAEIIRTRGARFGGVTDSSDPCEGLLGPVSGSKGPARAHRWDAVSVFGSGFRAARSIPVSGWHPRYSKYCCSAAATVTSW